jgi:hypothetical protein
MKAIIRLALLFDFVACTNNEDKSTAPKVAAQETNDKHEYALILT